MTATAEARPLSRGPRPYLAVVKGEYLANSIYRFNAIFTLLGGLLYTTLLYFLWRRIYDHAPVLGGMSFGQAFTYIAVAGAIFTLYKTWIEWGISRKILDGSIVMDLLKPLDYQAQALSRYLGFLAFNLVNVTLPTALFLVVVFGAQLELPGSVPAFLLAAALGAVISFSLDFIVGVSAFYTESIWGISITKDVVVTALSGVVVPVAFFPEKVQGVLEVLPFQAIFHIPLTILTDGDLGWRQYAELYAVQLLWLVALAGAGRLFYLRARRALTINGG